jgi:hypothetical protein
LVLDWLILQFKNSFCGSVTDVDFQDWFCGTSIHQNIREVVKEVLIPVLVEDFLPTSLSSLEEMFQMAPSAMMSRCPCLFRVVQMIHTFHYRAQ